MPVSSGTEIIRGLNLTVKAGEVAAIMGPNGSGKSTLSYILAGREDYEVTEGDILYNGQSILEMDPAERATSGMFLAFQYPMEIPGVATMEFLKVAMNEQRKARGEEPLKIPEFLKRVKEAAARSSMDMAMLKRPLNVGFSGGEKKRAEILQMKLLEPKLCVLDETDSGLDIDALKIVSDGVNALRAPDRAFLVITHYQRLLEHIVPDTCTCSTRARSSSRATSRWRSNSKRTATPGSSLKKSGLPTRRVEAWHYTDLKTLLRAVPAQAGDAGSDARHPLVEGSTVLPVIQGRPDHKARAGDLVVSSYAEQLSNGSAAAGLGALDKDDAVGRINGSFVRDGYVIDVPAETDLEEPLEIQFVHAGGQTHTRLPVSFGAGVKATVIERHLSVTADAALVSHVSDITLGEGAELTWIIVQQQGADDTHLGQIRVDLGADAKLKLFVINAGGQLVRQELHIKVTGEGADLTLRGINLLGAETHTDVTMVLGHNVPNTGSTEIIRNVVFDRAKGVFQGMIRVAPDAQKTDAKMACNTLLMSDDAEFSVKPELEIFADDVQCGHGATVADIDPMTSKRSAAISRSCRGGLRQAARLSRQWRLGPEAAGVLDAIRMPIRNEYANVHRGLHYLSNVATDAYEKSRETVRRFLNAPSVNEIVFTSNDLEAINTVASATACPTSARATRSSVDHGAPLQHRAVAFHPRAAGRQAGLGACRR
jgi:Fe-S cluster assembly protein SufD